VSGERCGIDTGGTFTDLVLIGDDGAVEVRKTLSTPPNFEAGVLDAVRMIAAPVSEGGIGAMPSTVAHGTTVGTNAVIEENVEPVALLTTAGFADIIPQMRGSGRVAGLPDEEVINLHETSKPAPLVTPDLIFEIDERMDCFGDEVVVLDEAAVEAAVGEIVERGITAVAICFLWSFLNTDHEDAARAVVQRVAPDLHVSVSSTVAPRWGEYERFVATVLNAALQPVMTSYVSSLEQDLERQDGRLQLMQSNGGTMAANEAMVTPLLTLHSGPVGGIMACRNLGEELGIPNIIATDMGGTSFDVGIIYNYAPQMTATSVVRQYEYFVPAVDVETIGAGGGSIATVDPLTGALHVGPKSAGAEPGPVCYGRGGTEPTVTDADVVLGRLGADTFRSGQFALDRAAAEEAIGRLAEGLGLETIEAAAGIVEIVDNRMADLTRAMTVQKGLDARDFVLFAYGGAGPCHVGAYARELGCSSVVIPRGNAASVWSAFGIAQAPMLKVHESSVINLMPVPAEELTGGFRELEGTALEHMNSQGVASDEVVLQREVDLRYRNQIYEIPIDVPGGDLGDDDVARLEQAFGTRYEQIYGAGAGFKGMGVELVTMRLRSIGGRAENGVGGGERAAEPEPSEIEPTGSREVFWSRAEGFRESAIFADPDALVPGGTIAGPAVVELPDTTVCIHAGQTLRVDGASNLRLEV
jgi:N-methylhydantoinase A